MALFLTTTATAAALDVSALIAMKEPGTGESILSKEILTTRGMTPPDNEHITNGILRDNESERIEIYWYQCKPETNT